MNPQPSVREPSTGDALPAWARDVARCLRSMRLSGGPGVRVSCTPNGTTVSVAPAARPSRESPGAPPLFTMRHNLDTGHDEVFFPVGIQPTASGVWWQDVLVVQESSQHTAWAESNVLDWHDVGAVTTANVYLLAAKWGGSGADADHYNPATVCWAFGPDYWNPPSGYDVIALHSIGGRQSGEARWHYGYEDIRGPQFFSAVLNFGAQINRMAIEIESLKSRVSALEGN